MSDHKRRDIKIFVASPSDVLSERNAIEEAADIINKSQDDYFLKVVKWETSVTPGIGDDAQSVVEEQIGKFTDYDIFILIMWHKFGSPTKDGRTGTLREFEAAYASWKRTQKPYIMTYFCNASLPPSDIDPMQLFNVAEFKKRKEIKEESLYHEYSVRDEFVQTARTHLWKVTERIGNKPHFSKKEFIGEGVELLYQDITKAQHTFDGVVYTTPLVKSHQLSDQLDCNVYLKLENLQTTGSFKIRGAMSATTAYFREGHLHFVTASAGNHGLGIAFASKRIGAQSTVFMPIDTPLTKVKAVEKYTDNVILQGNSFDETKDIALKFCRAKDFKFIHPFDDEKVIAGQGTIGLELINQWPKDEPPDYVLIPVGGAGLLAGVGVVLKKVWPNTRVVAVEAENMPGFAHAINSGRSRFDGGKPTLADGIAVAEIGRLTYPIAKDICNDIWLVSEENIAQAIAMLMEESKIVVEGAGATTLGAVLGQLSQNTKAIRGKDIVLVISGGNVDSMRISMLLRRGLYLQQRLALFRFTVTDRPGRIAAIGTVFAEANVNIIDLQHHPLSEQLRVGMTFVDVIVETRDAEHTEMLLAKLRDRGHDVMIIR